MAALRRLLKPLCRIPFFGGSFGAGAGSRLVFGASGLGTSTSASGFLTSCWGLGTGAGSGFGTGGSGLATAASGFVTRGSGLPTSGFGLVFVSPDFAASSGT